MSKCTKCGADIVWAVRLKTMANLPLVPLNPLFPDAPRFRLGEPRADGKRECERDDEGSWISHFSDCPAAASFSRRKKR